MMGFSRSDMNDESFRKLVSDAIHQHVLEVNEKVLEEFLTHVFYHQGAYDKKEDFVALDAKLDDIEKGWNGGVRLAYLSVPPTVFTDISKNLDEGGVTKGNAAFRVIVEKPVGTSLKTFEDIEKQLKTSFTDEQVYLLDHYLGKESVRNIYFLRHANPILERLFKNTLIHRVELTASEPAGLEGRAGYFEHTGTFRDMFQSHLLMMASLLTMRLMETEESIGHSRRDALEQFYIPPASSLNDIVIQGQYTGGEVNGETVVGYKDENGIDKNSRTNTFTALKLLSRTSRWQGVPFYLRSGKRMSKKETRISIEFQEPHPVGKNSTHNRLDIILQGEAGMKFFLQTKIGGSEPEYRPLIMSDPLVCMGDCLPEHSLLLLEAINGKNLWFLTFEEVRTAWKLIDPIQTHLEDPKTPLYGYAAGSHGPKEADEWLSTDGHTGFLS